jgi:hypothetical protein
MEEWVRIRWVRAGDVGIFPCDEEKEFISISGGVTSMGYPLERIAVCARTDRHHCLQKLVIPGAYVSIDGQMIKTDLTISAPNTEVIRF